MSSGLQHGARVRGFQRRHSLCPVSLPNSKFNAGPREEEEEEDPGAPGRWAREGRLPGSALGHIPFRVDRSVSMIEGGLGGEDKMAAAPPRPPPGLGLSAASLCSSSLSLSSSSLSPPASTRYKTELCRTYEESGTCKYGSKCQFAHGMHELRNLSRHPKYKTELCRTFHTIGFCPYGPRCHFIHNAEERRGPPPLSAYNKAERPRLQHSFSFAGFPSAGGLQDRTASLTPPALFSTEDLSDWQSNPFTYSSQELASLFGPSMGPPPEQEVQPAAPPSPTFFRPAAGSPPSPPDSLSDQEGYQSSLESPSGSESPLLDASRRLPIFSNFSTFSIADD